VPLRKQSTHVKKNELLKYIDEKNTKSNNSKLKKYPTFINNIAGVNPAILLIAYLFSIQTGMKTQINSNDFQSSFKVFKSIQNLPFVTSKVLSSSGQS
jgi:cytoskeletal protein RodZ